jgi:Tol biopolymer transport system component
LTLFALAVVLGGASAAGGRTSAAPAGRIVFSSNRAPDLYPQLFRASLDGSGRRQLTDPDVPVDDPALSPDATKLAYAAGRELHVRDVESGADEAAGPGVSDEPSWQQPARGAGS